MLTLQPGNMNRGGRNQGGGSGRPFTEADVTAIGELPFVEAVTGILSQQANAVSEEANWVTNIQGGNASFFEVNNWRVAEGREFTAQEVQGGAAVAVLGKTAATNLFPDGSAIGQRIRVNSVPIEVIGILESKGQSRRRRHGPRTAMTRLSRPSAWSVTGLPAEIVGFLAMFPGSRCWSRTAMTSSKRRKKPLP